MSCNGTCLHSLRPEVECPGCADCRCVECGTQTESIDGSLCRDCAEPLHAAGFEPTENGDWMRNDITIAACFLDYAADLRGWEASRGGEEVATGTLDDVLAALAAGSEAA